MKLAFDAAVAATHATVFDPCASLPPMRVVTDTRTLQRGDTYLALRGERFDGHDYVAEAIAKGAAAVIIDKSTARVGGTTTLLVANTLAALMSLAGLARGSFAGRVLAITGSNGKTTTKALLAQLLARRYGDRVLASPANDNNEIGVSTLLLAASNDAHDLLVVEMGARHVGDIEALVAIAKPQFGILTNIGEAHLEIMGSREALAKTKWALFGGGARAILNADDAESRERAPRLAQPPHWFAAMDEDRILSLNGASTVLVGASRLIAQSAAGAREERSVDVRVAGAHNRANLAAALAGALELGLDLDMLAAAIPTLVLPPGRFESISLASGVRLVYDAYNANLSGMLAALGAFAQEAAARRIAVLGSMAELGDGAPAMHVRVGAAAVAAKIEWLIVRGDFASDIAQGARDAGLSSERIVVAATNQAAAGWLREHTCVGDLVLLKGSRKYTLEEIVAELRT